MDEAKTAAQLALKGTIPTSNNQLRTAEKKPGWNARVFDPEGNLIETGPIGLIISNNPKMGVTVTYGLTLGGFDGWQIHETGGGGSVTTPFAVIDDVLYVGVVTQNRHTQGGPVDNTPRGYRKPGENPLENAIREYNEEIETNDAKLMVKIAPLPGQPVNQNSAHYETWGPDEGVKYFACEISKNALVANDGHYVFREDLLSAINEEERKKEAILGAKFIRADKALGLNDSFTLIAAAKIMLLLSKAGRDVRLS